MSAWCKQIRCPECGDMYWVECKDNRVKCVHCNHPVTISVNITIDDNIAGTIFDYLTIDKNIDIHVNKDGHSMNNQINHYISKNYSKDIILLIPIENGIFWITTVDKKFLDVELNGILDYQDNLDISMMIRFLVRETSLKDVNSLNTCLYYKNSHVDEFTIEPSVELTIPYKKELRFFIDMLKVKDIKNVVAPTRTVACDTYNKIVFEDATKVAITLTDGSTVDVIGVLKHNNDTYLVPNIPSIDNHLGINNFISVKYNDDNTITLVKSNYVLDIDNTTGVLYDSLPLGTRQFILPDTLEKYVDLIQTVSL